MNTFCTIITPAYLPLAKTLYKSLENQATGTSLHVLVISSDHTESGNEHFIVHNTGELAGSPFFENIQNKYGHTNPDHFRWALKPVFIAYLLNAGFDKVIFVDPDIYFVGDFDFILDALDHNDILLTPHWANLDPNENEDSLLAVMKGGLFNAGFIAANRSGIDAMTWWAGLCHYKMGKDTGLGLYDDQKYLDMLPVQFEKTAIIRHRGMNLAGWNIDNSKRQLVNGKLKINGIYDPVFIHFAKDTIVNILNRNDALLKPYLDEYIATLRDENFDLLGNLEIVEEGKFSSPAYSLKHRFRIRTRLKRFFFKLAEKL